MATPDGWTGALLGEVADAVSGCGFPRELQGTTAGRYPFFKVGDMNRPGNERELVLADNYVDDTVMRSLLARACPPGTVVFPKVGGALLTNKRRVLAVESVFDNNVMGLVPIAIEPAFLYQWMLCVDFASIVQPGALPSINAAQVKRMPLPLPPHGEQRKIAAILSSIDDTIEKTEAVIAQVDVVKKAMMQELLTRGMPGRHTRFKQTEIGEIPEQWDVVALGNLVESCDYGLSASLGADDAQVAVLRMGNLVDGEIDLSELKYVDSSRVGGTDLILRDGELLFNRTNSLALVGKVALFRGAARPISFASYLLRLKPRRHIVAPEWLNDLLNAPASQQRIQALAQPGVSQANINRGRLLELRFAVPSISEQVEIAAAIAVLRTRIQCERRALADLRAAKSALASLLLSGDLRVTPHEAPP